MDDFEDDTHFCLKCHNTIIGLENYVSHRKNNCMKHVGDHQKSPIPCQLLTNDESFSLKADDFFSSLELQSSSKKLIQTSSSGKSYSGILTRSKVTKDAPEPSKSGKNAWIGGHQLKELDYDDNQSKLIKAVANLERRKEDIGRNKEIPRIQVYEESDDESEDYDYDDETSDEDAPPRNHTGGKWKPSSPIYWKSSQPERDFRSPPPNFTGGKWKPTPARRNISPLLNEVKGKWKPEQLLGKDNEDIPPPTFTGSKWSQSKKQEFSLPSSDLTKGRWKSKSENPTKSSSEFPPPEHTKGKWKPDTSPDPIPSSYTKGKWMPTDTAPEETCSKEISPTYTKGKWLPSSKCSEKEPHMKISEDSPLRKSGGTVQYWCRPCNRRLASKVVYERHLKSEFHFKRTLRDNELEENFNFMKDERRIKRRKAVETVKQTEIADIKKKRARRRIFAKCQVCNSKVNINLMGKHLISHYHCRKGDLTSESSQKMILEYIGSIIQQSPFQCKICRFYFNTHKDFLDHWICETHLVATEKKSGVFFCSYCKFSCETNEMMYKHLISNVHNEVVSVINRSVPISIRKVNYNQCDSCNEKFLLNIQLKKHILTSGHTTSEDFEKKEHKCNICSQKFNSEISLQRHTKNVHKLKSFICGTCKLTFTNAEEVRLHRNSEQHYYATLEKKNASDKKVLEKQCQYCSENFENFLKLKEHIKIFHLEFHSRCPQCGMTFAVPQELSVHLRTKSCKFENISSKKHICSQCSFATDSLSQFLFHEALHGDAALMCPEKSYQASKPTPHYKCPKCTKFFPKSSLECHLRTHTKERPYTCSHCKATFVRKNNWLFHEKKHIPGKVPNKAKISKETGRPFLCSTCGASFKKRFILQQHMKIHTGKLYKCIETGCFFAGRSFGELKIHYQTHFDDRNFKCKLCDYKGKTKQQLLRHATIHEPVKKFKCAICPFTSRSSHHLKRHSRLHTGCKPYSCPHCLYKCNSLENLRKHILSTNKHPGKSLYGCKFCTENHFQTNLFKEFKAHLKTMHSDEIDKIDKIDNSTGVYEADNDSFFWLENSNKPVESSEPCDDGLEKESEAIQTPQNDCSTEPLSTTLISTIPQMNSSDGAAVLPLVPLKISKHEDICQESDTENWSLVGCYDVEESGTLVPFIKDENEDVIFKEHF